MGRLSAAATVLGIVITGCAPREAPPASAPPAAAAEPAPDPFPDNAASAAEDGSLPTEPPSEPPRRAACDDLPSRDVLETWEVRSICPPSGGPRPQPMTKVLDLGDGSFIFESRSECFRARYRKCFSK